MSYQKLFISRPSEGTKLWPKFLAPKSLKKAQNNLKNLEKTKKQKKHSIPGLLQKQKSKKPWENQKKQKNQKKQYSRTLAKVKMQKSKKPRENQKKQKKQKNPIFQDSCLLTLSPDFWFFCFFCFFWFSRGFLDLCIFTFARVLEYCFFWFFWFFWFSRGFLDFCFCKSPGILFFFGFLKVFYFFWHSQTIGANTKKTCKEVGFFWGGYHIYISGRDFPGRISAGTKLTCNSFLIQCKLAFILINVHFSPFFPWFQCYALFCCKYLYGIAPF